MGETFTNFADLLLQCICAKILFADNSTQALQKSEPTQIVFAKTSSTSYSQK